MSTAGRVRLTLITTILGMCALSAPPPRSSASAPFPPIVAPVFHFQAVALTEPSALPTNNTASSDEVEGWDANRSADLYGNEVSDAVTRYQFDDAGGLYEVHAPKTELPRLGSPQG